MFQPSAQYLRGTTRGAAALTDLAALLGGAALPLAFAPLGWFMLALASPALLFRLWARASAPRAFWRGWLYGLGMFGVGVSWVQISIHQFGLPLLAFSLSVTVLFVAVLALFPAWVGSVGNRLFAAGDPFRSLLALPALWTLAEWVRGWFLTGFPWLNLGYSQVDSTLGGFAPLFGVYGVSLATAWSAAMLAYASSARRRVWYLGLLIPLWGGAWLLGKLQWTERIAPPLQVALIQGNVPQSLKWLPGELKATLDKYAALTAPYWGRDLIIWPETAIPALYHEVLPFVEALEARAAGSELLTGIPYQDPTRGVYYNSVLLIGKGRHFYHKRHLVPFGEYLPLANVLGQVFDFLDIPMSSFTPGERRQPLLRVKGHGVGLSVCYEDAFGEEVIEALPQAGLLVNVSNDAWFGDSLAPHQHLEMARMRALESGRYLLRATNTGVSVVIDPKGQVRSRSPQFEPHALTAEVWAHQGVTPYVRFGNGPVLIAALTMLGLSLAASRRTRPALDSPAAR